MDYHQHTVPAGPPLVAVPAPSHPLTHHQLHQLQTLVQAEDSTSSRWSQYQQLWRHHHMQHINGKKRHTVYPKGMTKGLPEIILLMSITENSRYFDIFGERIFSDFN
ncbi:hypothetical protein C0J52_28437 [Blattella germanica]|nr:hypothetical protein C0J52_28437 [Blattella germanica]